jgi:adenine-specific DNA methylase
MTEPAQLPATRVANAVPFPRTRYQGSKRKLADAIVGQLAELDYTTVLDAFGGTAAVAHAFKRAGKAVTYNDLLAFNHQIGLALIENDTVRLDKRRADTVGVRRSGRRYGDFIARTFPGIYFTDDENRWLDTALGNIRALEDQYQRALAWFALFQAAMVKRPYNLFHRANLYMRTADVARSFGNKTTWDRSFADHFRVFAAEANEAVVDSHGRCRAICRDALDIDGAFDLVYVDTPYINHKGVGVDYRDFYHFLEGMVRYDEWPTMIDHRAKHRRLMPQPDPWSDPRSCHGMFRRLFDRYRAGILVVSYRSNGVPTIEELAAMLREFKCHVRIIDGRRYQYALSTERTTREVLLVGSD